MAFMLQFMFIIEFFSGSKSCIDDIISGTIDTFLSDHYGLYIKIKQTINKVGICTKISKTTSYGLETLNTALGDMDWMKFCKLGLSY